MLVPLMRQKLCLGLVLLFLGHNVMTYCVAVVPESLQPVATFAGMLACVMQRPLNSNWTSSCLACKVRRGSLVVVVVDSLVQGAPFGSLQSLIGLE